MSNLLNQAQQAVSGVMGGKSQSGQQKEQQAGLSNITIHHDQAGNRFYCQLENNQEVRACYICRVANLTALADADSGR